MNDKVDNMIFYSAKYHANSSKHGMSIKDEGPS